MAYGSSFPEETQPSGPGVGAGSHSPATPATAAPAPGMVLNGRYDLKNHLASGGMAQVWRAHDFVLNREVAVKILHSHMTTDTSFVARFRREAVAAAKLSHPSIVAVYDTVSQPGLEAIVMELIEGRTLRSVLNDLQALSPATVVNIGVQVSAALTEAHRAGIVHRDIKPANIMISVDQRVMVTDFGIAKADHDADLTTTGTLLGTAKYLSPEQVSGTGVDARSDIYSLGVVLFEALAGRPPFQAETDAGIALARLNQDPPRVSQFRGGIPSSLDDVILNAMARDANVRYNRAIALKAALGAVDLSGVAGGPTDWGNLQVPPSPPAVAHNPTPTPTPTPTPLPAPSPSADVVSPHTGPSQGPPSQPVPAPPVPHTPSYTDTGPYPSAPPFTDTGPYPTTPPITGSGPYPTTPPITGSGNYPGAPPFPGTGPYPSVQTGSGAYPVAGPPAAPPGHDGTVVMPESGLRDAVLPPEGRRGRRRRRGRRAEVAAAEPAKRRRSPIRMAFAALFIGGLGLAVAILVNTFGGARSLDVAAAGFDADAGFPIVSAIPIDPLGDGNERQAWGPRAIDDAVEGPESFWQTETYKSESFSGLKDGVGLVLTLDEVRDIDRVDLLTGTTGWDADVYLLADDFNAESLGVVGGFNPADLGERVGGISGGDLRERVDVNTAGRKVLIWITESGVTEDEAAGTVIRFRLIEVNVS